MKSYSVVIEGISGTFPNYTLKLLMVGLGTDYEIHRPPVQTEDQHGYETVITYTMKGDGETPQTSGATSSPESFEHSFTAGKDACQVVVYLEGYEGQVKDFTSLPGTNPNPSPSPGPSPWDSAS